MYHALIASDLDGTLLPEGNKQLDTEIFNMIRRLKEKGVLFCAASGRSYGSLRELFAPVADEILYLAENSAVIYDGATLLETICIPPDICAEITASIAVRDDCYARVNTDVAHYYIVPDEENADYLRSMEYPDARTAHSFKDVEGSVTQITACSKGDISVPAKDLLPMWKNRIGAAITGEHWLDFTAAGKGKGLNILCHHFGIAPENTYAFGDNFNDVSMLEAAGHAFIMSSADSLLLTQFPNHTDSVLKTLSVLEKTL